MMILAFRNLAITSLVVWWCLPGNLAASGDAERFQQIYEAEWAFRLKEFPLLASSTGSDGYAGELGHVGEVDQLRRYEYWQKVRQQLNSISCDRLSREQCINYRLFTKQIEDCLARYETHAYLIPFNSDWGFYMEWGRLPAETDFTGAGDYRDYLSRISQVGVVMNEYIALMQTGVELGFTQPRVILDGRDEPIKAQLVDKAEDSPFFTPFLKLPETIIEPERAELLAAAQEVIGKQVIPAYQRLFDFYHEVYIPGARATLGAYQLPDGERFYQAQIRLYATVDMSPKEIHDIGLSEVKRIRAEMDAIIAELGFEGGFAEFLAFLRTDPQF
ncbi:MAG: DUF885 domain-containing protein, partial [Lysobacterales bacterium]